VVALGVHTACRYRAWCTAAAIATAMLVEVVCVTNLAGYGHPAAVTAVPSRAGAEAGLRTRRRAA
jgi:hypothetical protein